MLRRRSTGKSESSDREKDREKGDTDTEAKRRHRHTRVSRENMTTTFENMVSTINHCGSENVDRDSVVRMLGSIHKWLTSEPNMQLDVPVPAGSKATKKMWPHGAVVDTRIPSKGGGDGSGLHGLRELDHETASNVASSVVSSNHDDVAPHRPKGNVLYDIEEDQAPSQAPKVQRVANIGQQIGTQPVAETVPSPQQPPALGRRGVPVREMPSSYSAQRTSERFSLIGQVAPPTRATVTPEIASPIPRRKKVVRTRVGAANRAVQDTEGTEVVFED